MHAFLPGDALEAMLQARRGCRLFMEDTHIVRRAGRDFIAVLLVAWSVPVVQAQQAVEQLDEVLGTADSMASVGDNARPL